MVDAMKTLVHGIMRDLDAEQAAYQQRCDRLAESVHNAKQWEIARTCARHELESDEFYTKEQKAWRILAQSPKG